MSKNTLYIVHAIDTEGPLAEASPTFDMTLPKREVWWPEKFDGAIDPIIDRHRKEVLGSWFEIAEMLREVTGKEFRQQVLDDKGQGWIFNWFCMDHIGYLENPRGREMGVHRVFDFYRDMVERQKAGDALHWHFHPMSTYRQAHKCATSYLNSDNLLEILCRRVIDRKWFPSVHRAGFQDERPDSHWFLEQWMPFDLSNTSSDDFDPVKNPDMTDGRFSDWRFAPRSWETYHPSHRNYQNKGDCRRTIGRCLNLLNRFANMTQEELDLAFDRASSGAPTLVGLASHDWRDLGIEVAYFRQLLQRSREKFPDVKVVFSEAKEAFRQVQGLKNDSLKLDCRAQVGEDGLVQKLTVNVADGELFGPQPFLAIETRSHRFIHDNFNQGSDSKSFNYVFDSESVLPSDVKSVGIASNNSDGNQSVHVLRVDEIKAKKKGEVSF